MRVTNGMIRNNMLNALHNNMSRLDTLYNQMNTLKKVQRPSDDPIITGRSLKLRINVLEAQQYKSNTDEATSWMSVTEKALSNITEILKDIRTRCVNAATDTLEAKDREKLQVDIDQLWKQLQQESNVTYVGRHVFSGYKTNEPVMFAKDTMLTKDTNLLGEMTLLKGTTIPPGGLKLADGTTILPAGGTLTDDLALPLTSIAGNTNLTNDIVTTQSITLPAGTNVGAGQIILPNGTTLAAAAPLGAPVTLPMGTVLKAGFTTPAAVTIEAGTILPSGTGLIQGSMNPNVLNQTNNQNIEYEVGVGSTIAVNTLGMDSVMSKLFTAIKEIKDGLATHSDSTPGNEISLYELFNGKIGEFDKELSSLSEMTADLGSRMTRLEYTASRLADDKTNFTELLSKTEDVDLEEIYTEFNAQYAVYQSALQATSKVIMNTLADFLR